MYRHVSIGEVMRIFLRRLILVLIIAIIASMLWKQRDRIALLNNNNIRIQGDWYRVEMNFKGTDVYNFSERLISVNNEVQGSYELRSNDKLEVNLNGEITDYILSFDDDDNMVWSIEVKGKTIPSVRWRR
jgi:uncharacterized protein YxjI